MLPEATSPGSSEAKSTSINQTGTADFSARFVRVEFKGNRRQYFTNPMEFQLHMGDWVVVRVEKGEDLGRIALLLNHLPEGTPYPGLEVLRRATAKDVSTFEQYREREASARQIFKEKVAKNGLEMKLVDVEYQFDGRKLTFFFTADGRVDFRQLVKDLAAAFRTRIELRQIGARDEVRRFGGAGPCGQMLCCSSFIHTFCPITTQMAKDQNLPLNPSKISGCCGRLKCCLRYEIKSYRDTLRVLPRWEARLETQNGPAIVEKLDVFNMTATLKFESGETQTIDAISLPGILAPGFKLPVGLEETAEEDESLSRLLDDSDDGECGDYTEGSFE
ncbi:MAG TPA: regulatory iron-sulfur-containing complex subunit RicT [bacterium]|jgi:cell fate regulator YaaT (PSP1 superfamily)